MPPRPEFPDLRCSLAIEPPAGEHWIHEIKFNGYRTVLVIEGGEASGLVFVRER